MAAERPISQFTRLESLLLRLAERRAIDGIEIVAENEGQPALDRAEAALVLIRTFDPVRYNHIRRDLERVWIRLLPGPFGQFSARLSACELDPRFVLDPASTTAIVAAVIVHEAAHARLARYGVGYTEDMRARVEALCVRRELAFAAKLPDGDAVRAWIEANTELSPEAFTDTAFAQRERAGQVEALRYLCTPEWLIRLVLALTAAKLKVLGLFGAPRARDA